MPRPNNKESETKQGWPNTGRGATAEPQLAGYICCASSEKKNMYDILGITVLTKFGKKSVQRSKKLIVKNTCFLLRIRNRLKVADGLRTVISNIVSPHLHFMYLRITFSQKTKRSKI